MTLPLQILVGEKAGKVVIKQTEDDRGKGLFALQVGMFHRKVGNHSSMSQHALPCNWQSCRQSDEILDTQQKPIANCMLACIRISSQNCMPLSLTIRKAKRAYYTSACCEGRIILLKDYKTGDVIIREAPLAAIQHSVSKEDCLCCSCCCCFLGSVELQVAWKLRSSGRHYFTKGVLNGLRGSFSPAAVQKVLWHAIYCHVWMQAQH